LAFRDITKVFYDGEIKIEYKDKAHRYYAYPRVNYDLPVEDKKAWGKNLYAKGTTTLLGDTLEKKGLMTWPMGMALQELFGFYDFDTKDADSNTIHLTGFSQDKGTLWEDGHLLHIDQETAKPLVLSASKNWTRKQKKGADIGSVVHDAIEHYIKNVPFDIAEQYMWNIKETEEDVTPAEFQKALEEFEADVAMANRAFTQFCIWWEKSSPILLGAEDLVYSREFNICGTFDGLIRINGRVILCDWKTSNASASAAAAMPEGINYQYFIQSAIYAMAWEEMGNDKIDDLMIVSCRKDGGFTTIMASELGLSMEDCYAWAKSVINCYAFAAKTKKGLIAHAKENTNV
jgi:hypothetical protein